MGNFYLTTTLPYVNSDPHIGFAYEIIAADVIARTRSLAGDDVFFNTGTDEHGQKIFDAAAKAGKDVREYVGHYANEFKKLQHVLGLSNDLVFIRTTDPKHEAAAVEMWKRCEKAGDIYKKSYEGLYCVGCERFLSEKDIENGMCVIHGKPPEMLKEENYFFRFSKYSDRLLEYLRHPGVMIPEWRRDEAMRFVESGLEDFSISREKKRLSWGVPVPGDDTQVVYVWFDALTNYISTLGWPDEGGNFKKYWTEGSTLQLAGKDQVRFQSLMWQAMLMSAEIKNTDQIFYHGFINSGGQKMSKSLGNVISPYELVKKYGTDATRYLLLRHVHPFDDSDVTWEKLDEWYTAGLSNGLGNFVSRVMKLSEEHLSRDDISVFADDVIKEEVFDEYGKKLSAFRLSEAMDIVWKYISSFDEVIQKQKPFELIRTNPEKGKEAIKSLVWRVARVGRLIESAMPATSERIIEAIRANKKPENLFPRLS